MHENQNTGVSPGAHERASASGSEPAESEPTRPMLSTNTETQERTESESNTDDDPYTTLRQALDTIGSVVRRLVWALPPKPQADRATVRVDDLAEHELPEDRGYDAGSWLCEDATGWEEGPRDYDNHVGKQFARVDEPDDVRQPILVWDIQAPVGSDPTFYAGVILDLERWR